jgi:hypothetical protein
MFPATIVDGVKKPLITGWQDRATTDLHQIEAWWRKWPRALIGHPTGIVCSVLDVDVKNGKDGLASLAELGYSDLLSNPIGPVVRTPSGGFHIYFRAHNDLRNSVSKIGPGLDWRSKGGFVILPSPASGYEWNSPYESLREFVQSIASRPAIFMNLLPKNIDYVRRNRPVGEARTTDVLDRYGEAALKNAYRAIVEAPDGTQRNTLNSEAYSIGAVVGAGLIPRDVSLRVLVAAGMKMKSHDPGRPWREKQVERTVMDGFRDGVANPRASSDEVDREVERVIAEANHFEG